jgi:formylglycine-generating enzyme required for sulfatase activity
MLTTGTVLQDRYRIVSLLGQGGMGAVYRAWDTRLNVPVALKEMVPQPGLDARTLAQLRQQFQQEATVLARLNHSHLVDVTDFFEEGGNAYLVMKFIEGESLADRIAREGPVPESEVLLWAGQLLDALAHCHSRGVIHRDIKPQNVVITPEGQAVLVDFGLVKLWDPRDPRTRTAMRGMGTPEYAPPEQYGIQPGHTDPRSDLYSLGATLYHALTGQAPLTANDRMAAPGQFVPVRGSNPRVSRETEAVVLRAMELPLVNRFQSAAEMRAALGGGAFVPAPPVAEKRQATKVMPGARPSAPIRQKRIPVWQWIAAVVAAALLVGLAGQGLGWWPRAEPTEAPTEMPAAAPTEPPTEEPTRQPTSTPTVALTATPTAEPTKGPTPAGPPAGASLGDTLTRPTDGMVMVYVPAGEFEMGSTEGDSDEQPVHAVALDGFWIDQTEVTNAQFAAFLNERGNQTAGGVTWLELEDENCLIERVGGEFQPKNGYADHPVVEVSWYGAAAYCEWAGARLPTEAEWEYAARGEQGYIYPWGDTFDGTRLNFCDVNCTYSWKKAGYGDGYERTAPVGSYPDGASWCGAQDLTGNVWEWVADWYGDYPPGRQVNPVGPSSGEYRVLRGGSWGDGQRDVRAADRYHFTPDDRNIVVGFRCVGLPGE